MAIVALIALLVAAGGGFGFLAWQKTSEFERAQADLASAKAGFDKARLDLRKALQESAALGKEVTELKLTADQMRAERDSVRSFMVTEQSAGVRLRAELALAKEQVSYLSARAPASAVKGMPKAPVVQPAPAAKGR